MGFNYTTYIAYRWEGGGYLTVDNTNYAGVSGARLLGVSSDVTDTTKLDEEIVFRCIFPATFLDILSWRRYTNSAPRLSMHVSDTDP